MFGKADLDDDSDYSSIDSIDEFEIDDSFEDPDYKPDRKVG